LRQIELNQMLMVPTGKGNLDDYQLVQGNNLNTMSCIWSFPVMQANKLRFPWGSPFTNFVNSIKDIDMYRTITMLNTNIENKNEALPKICLFLNSPIEH
jgi:hypothetical protein